jgi:hypothetical protein
MCLYKAFGGKSKSSSSCTDLFSFSTQIVPAGTFWIIIFMFNMLITSFTLVKNVCCLSSSQAFSCPITLLRIRLELKGFLNFLKKRGGYSHTKFRQYFDFLHKHNNFFLQIIIVKGFIDKYPVSPIQNRAH